MEDSQKLNSKVVLEIVNQAKERLQDLLETNKAFISKAFTLLSGYITLSTVFLGLAINMYAKTNQTLLVLSCLCVSVGFFISTLFVLKSIKTSKHGTLGCDPNDWLNDEYTKGDDDTFNYMMLYLAENYQKRIQQSRQTNIKKNKEINIAILLGGISPFYSILPFILTFL